MMHNQDKNLKQNKNYLASQYANNKISLRQSNKIQQINDDITYQDEQRTQNDKENLNLKLSIPIKQYSNKFFRESKIKKQFEQNELITKNRLLSIVKKNKYKRFTKLVNINCAKKSICKTQPSENKSQFLVTFGNFHKKSQEIIKTDCMYHNQENIEDNCIQRNEKLITIQNQLINKNADKQGSRHKIITQGSLAFKPRKRQNSIFFLSDLNNQKKDKISTSRALELFSKIYLKDKIQVPQKSKTSHKKNNILDFKYGENNQNFQARQIVLLQKEKSIFSIQQKNPSKSILKHRVRMNSDIRKELRVQQREQNFLIDGWDTYA